MWWLTGEHHLSAVAACSLVTVASVVDQTAKEIAFVAGSARHLRREMGARAAILAGEHHGGTLYLESEMPLAGELLLDVGTAIVATQRSPRAKKWPWNACQPVAKKHRSSVLC